MQRKSRKELETENAQLKGRVEKLEREWREEYRTIKLLEAAGLVSESKIQQARSLASTHS